MYEHVQVIAMAHLSHLIYNENCEVGVKLCAYIIQIITNGKTMYTFINNCNKMINIVWMLSEQSLCNKVYSIY